MKAPTAVILFSSILLSSCSFEVENTKSPPQSGVGTFQMLVLDEGGGDHTFFAFDTRSGALHEKDGNRWREVVDPLNAKSWIAPLEAK